MPIRTHIDVQFQEISVMQMNISAPFPLEQIMKIRAYDDNGNDLTKYLNIMSNRINFNVPGKYVAPVFLQANNQIINQVDVVVNVLAPTDANNVLPKISKNTDDVYVEQTDLPHPYRIADFIKIQAQDRFQQNITRNLVLNMSQVNYSQAGDYVVIIKAPDDSGNIAISTFHLHVLTPEQVDQMENDDYDEPSQGEPEPAQYTPTKKRRQEKPTTTDDDDNDEHATYWFLVKKYWWIYIVIGIVWFTCWDMFG